MDSTKGYFAIDLAAFSTSTTLRACLFPFIFSLFPFPFSLFPFSFLSAQTTLPTGWGFNGAPPSGWTISGTDVYTSSGYYVVSPACKLDNTGDFVQINFSDAPGDLTYYLRGSGFSGGTFSVQESVNGTNWTNLRFFTTAPASLTEYTDTPAYTTRYIRFIYTQKVSGNIALDEVNLAIAPLSNAPEISVKQNNNPVADGGTSAFNSPVGINTTISFMIENLGMLDTLFLDTPVIGGPNASEFNVSTFTAAVPPFTSGTIEIDFTPPQAGTRLAILTIANNDADENPYNINLYGVGGTLATEPTAQPTNLYFSFIKSYRFRVQFSAAFPSPDGYLVLRKTGSPITDVPMDGKIYMRGDSVGNSQVAFAGSSTSFYPNNIMASTDYYFAVFPYNGPGQFRNYLQANPLTGNKTSAGNMMGGYYAGINAGSSTFLDDLHNKIYPHYQVYYANFTNTNINLFASRDTAGGKKVVTCVYSGYQYVYNEPFDWSVMSREHTYCHSWMPTYPADNPELKEYDDQHHLFPAQFLNANQVRSNYPLGEVVNVTTQFLGCKFGKDANGRDVFEPREEHKGDAARALMYVAVCYNTVNGNNWKFRNPISGSIPYGQDQDVLKQWHFQDPPDNWEIARNDFLDSLQGNRNPFVDSAHFACYIDFSNMTKINNPPPPCYPANVFDQPNDGFDWMIYPNPNDGRFFLGPLLSLSEITITDILGKTVFYNFISSSEIDVSFLDDGIYFILIKSKDGNYSAKVVLSR